MKPTEVLALVAEEQVRARSIVAGLGHCTVRLSRATQEMGAFVVDPKSGAMEIRISRHLRDADQVRETIRHEFGHQAAWERYGYLGHGAYWQTLALYLGCTPEPCGQDGFDPEVMRKRTRYAVTCRGCGMTTTRQRRSKLVDKPWRFACASCGGAFVVQML